MKDDRLYLIHIDECIARIEQYVEDDKDAFLQSLLIQDAVLRNLQTLSESTQRLSEKQKETHPEIDWRRIAGFRNVIVHDYLGVDVPYVWDVIVKELPALKAAIEKMLKDV